MPLHNSCAAIETANARIHISSENSEQTEKQFVLACFASEPPDHCRNAATSMYRLLRMSPSRRSEIRFRRLTASHNRSGAANPQFGLSEPDRIWNQARHSLAHREFASTRPSPSGDPAAKARSPRPCDSTWERVLRARMPSTPVLHARAEAGVGPRCQAIRTRNGARNMAMANIAGVWRGCCWFDELMCCE